MSDKSEGPGWWIASDGKWYPPELHPSVRDDSSATASAPEAGTTPPRRWQQGGSEKSPHVGPQFPDLFQKAMQGSHLADNISVKYDGDDERNNSQPTTSTSKTMTNTRSGGGSSVAAGVAGATIGAPAKRKWRRGH
jgi:hypothetical protein